MKFLRVERVSKDRAIIVTQSRFLWWTFETKYLASEKSCPGYWEWLEMPNLTTVGDDQFQLNAWLKEYRPDWLSG